MKMKQRGGGGGDFKSPGGGSTPGSPVGNTKKKRRTSTVGSNSNQGSSSPMPMPELIQPPQGVFRSSGFGDTIIASNPFDDTPAPSSVGPPPGQQQQQQQQMPPHMNMNCPPGPPGGPPGNGPPMNMGMPPNQGGGMPGMGPGSSPMGGNPMSGLPNGPPGPPPHMNQGPPSMHMNMNMGGPNGPMSMGPGNGPMGPGPGQMVPVGMGQTQWNGPPKPAPIQSGKIYPHDQPMVFNPQNPNAPPIYPCGVCHKEVHDNDQAIPCESGCNFWFHRICTGLTEHAYHFLCQEVYAEWVCDKCLSTKQIPLVKFKP